MPTPRLSIAPLAASLLLGCLALPLAFSAGSSLGLVLPTENTAIFSDPAAYYMYINRNFEGQTSNPWQGGQSGFIRNPKRTSAGLVYTKFHEGMDIRPLRRSSDGTPLDEVRAVAAGRVVHVNDSSSASNYGRYIVIEHNWGDGPFYSLYAHLLSTSVKPGQAVSPGYPIGRLGYSGVGIDKTRAHLHFELNMMLHRGFETWHDRAFSSPNHHRIYNGLNLTGLDVATLYKAYQNNKKLSLPDFVAKTEPYYKVIAPRGRSLDLLNLYPWLGHGVSKSSPSWEITFSASGIPLRVESSSKSVTTPVISWVKKSPTYHSYYTNGRVSGAGANASLSASGQSYIRLITGQF
jgi:murein DD-endopeptidase MepM/ murein hydrolase activator NlpD